MGVTVVQDTDSSLAYTGSGWATTTGASYLGSHDHYTHTNGDSVTFTFNGRACYLLTSFQGNYSGNARYYVDGNQVFLYNTDPNSTSGILYRALLPIARNLADGSHTVQIVASNDNGIPTIDLNAYIAISGAKLTGAAGTLVCVGDSWTYGYGVPQSQGAGGQCGYTLYLQQMLAQIYSRPMSLIRKGVPGDCLYGTSGFGAGDSALTGGMYRIISDAIPNNPEFLTLLFGHNDLRNNTGSGNSGRMMGSLIFNTLCFLEDAFDTSQVKIAIGTPGHISSYYSQTQLYASNIAGTLANYEEAVENVRRIVAAFPWCGLADIYAAADGRDDLLATQMSGQWTAGGDWGLHPNDTYHHLMAREFAHALAAGTAWHW